MIYDDIDILIALEAAAKLPQCVAQHLASKALADMGPVRTTQIGKWEVETYRSGSAWSTVLSRDGDCIESDERTSIVEALVVHEAYVNGVNAGDFRA